MKEPLRNEDLAKRIVAEGSEIKYDTLVSVLNQCDRIIKNALCDGFSVNTGVCRFAPRVSGSWIGENARFDPAIHRVTLDIIPSAEMRAALEQVGVEVLTVKESGAFIGLVTDALTGNTDETVSIDEDIVIEGDKIKVAGTDESVGVYFVDNKGVATKVLRRLTVNEPKKIIARVPGSLTSGDYTLRVVTQFSNSAVLLKEPRTIEYSRPLHLQAVQVDN